MPSFALSLNALNGNVTANPATGPFDSAIVVSLKAIPSPGFHFVSWSDGASGVIDSTTVTMNSAKSVTANFSLNTYQLTANAVTGGTITSPEGTFPQSVDHGTETTITALGNQDYIFDGWSVTSGLAIIADSNALFTTVTLNSGNATVQAKFIINTYTVAFQVQEGSGGHIIGTMEQTIMHGGNCTEVTAVAGIDSTFSGWTGDSISPDNPLVITNVTSDMTITTTIEATNPSPKNK